MAETDERARMMECVRAQVGKPYIWGTHGPGSFDCSGLVGFCYKRATGRDIGYGSVAQFAQGTPVSRENARPGDVFFWDTFGAAPGHNAVYIGGGRMIHALNEDAGVVEGSADPQNIGGNNRFMGIRDFGFAGDNGGVDPNPKDPNGGNGAMDDAVIQFGNAKHPAYTKSIVPKPWEGAGFDRVAPRKIVGGCDHQWWGYGDKFSLVRLFGTGGERQGDALTDYSCTFEGELVMLNEPTGTRAPHANGPANDLDGDGPLFVRTLGISAVNGRLFSCEWEGKGEKMTPAMLEVGSSLHAYWFDQARVPYTDYPMNPNTGCVTHLQHWEFGPKECPFAGIRAQTNLFQDLVRGKLKAAQTGGVIEPIPPVNPPAPDHDWLPSGMTEEVVKELFGAGYRTNLDGSRTEVAFDKKGIVSNAWLARGAKENVYPKFSGWWVMQDADKQRNLVSFSNGWVLIGVGNDRGSWNWLRAQ